MCTISYAGWRERRSAFHEVVVRLETALSGARREVMFHLISMDATLLTSFAPSVTHANGTSSYATDMTLPSSDFRVLVTGLDENGFPFQRVSPRLFVGDR